MNQRPISNVELAYKLMVLNNADSRALLDDLDKAIRSRFLSQLYDKLGGRIKYVRDRGTHGQWGDVSAEGVFYATLTAVLYFASDPQGPDVLDQLKPVNPCWDARSRRCAGWG